VFVPVTPAVTLQLKFVMVSVAVIVPPEPYVVDVSDTTPALEVAVTEETFRVIAAARLLASSAITPSTRKSSPVFMPVAPPVNVGWVQLKPVAVDVVAMLLPAAPQQPP